jgi:hypothetical protein
MRVQVYNEPNRPMRWTNPTLISWNLALSAESKQDNPIPTSSTNAMWLMVEGSLRPKAIIYFALLSIGTSRHTTKLIPLYSHPSLSLFLQPNWSPL